MPNTQILRDPSFELKLVSGYSERKPIRKRVKRVIKNIRCMSIVDNKVENKLGERKYINLENKQFMLEE